ncbi:hypothetical protein CEUSTIGMA_g5394.t1 [Chlamydomonas eustigma]|uniref:Uncharacterized protein n=1 Tax=Chlamydomonas eustigma TaxID=1157962 RepID=A0A250X4Y7_9CHLO|nr:hypothetical protein CEUSTIGMA_g5394.t1 [Chlamydomonas eustigma]|eukprot:GAX77952.1 hypothetical protein CEUSTIGMA_g5394.t1 [Chlamydomonas eustigma]
MVSDPKSMHAQSECLDMLLDYLPKRHPELYRLEGSGKSLSIIVLSTAEALLVSDYQHCPLELCGRIVQEDLVIMRRVDPEDPDKEAGGAADRHVMTAASVVFSFGDLEARLGKPLSFLHAPVPGFEQELNVLVNKALDGIPVERPLWRNNWDLVSDGQIDLPTYEVPLGSSQQVPPTPVPASERWLKVEYQTFRRLPSSQAVLSLCGPSWSHQAMCKYKGLESEQASQWCAFLACPMVSGQEYD